MSELSSTIVATLGDGVVTLQDLLIDLHRHGQLKPIIAKSIVDHTIDAKVASENVEVTDADKQQAFDRFRSANRLHKADDTQRWLESRQMTLDDLETMIARRVGRQKLMTKVTRGNIEPFFHRNREQFDAAQLSRIVIGSASLANEIKAQLMEEGADFVSLARQHSTDSDSKRKDGQTLPVRRKRLPAAIATAVFASQSGDVLGPFQLGDKHVIVRVHRVLPGKLTPRIAAMIQRRLFEDWIRRQVAELNPQVKLVDQLQTNSST